MNRIRWPQLICTAKLLQRYTVLESDAWERVLWHHLMYKHNSLFNYGTCLTGPTTHTSPISISRVARGLYVAQVTVRALPRNIRRCTLVERRYVLTAPCGRVKRMAGCSVRAIVDCPRAQVDTAIGGMAVPQSSSAIRPTSPDRWPVLTSVYG